MRTTACVVTFGALTLCGVDYGHAQVQMLSSSAARFDEPQREPVAAAPQSAEATAGATTQPTLQPRKRYSLFYRPPRYVLLGDGSGAFTTNGQQFDAAAGLAGAIIWPRQSQYLAVSGRGGTATTVGSAEDLGNVTLVPGTTQVNFRIEYLLMRQAWWGDTPENLEESCWGQFCGGIATTLQVGAAKVRIGEANEPTRAVFLAGDLGGVLRVGKSTEDAFGADFGLGVSVRHIGGAVAMDQTRRGQLAELVGSRARTFVGPYASAGIRVGDLRLGVFVPMLSGGADYISGLQALILAQVQARILDTSAAK